MPTFPVSVAARPPSVETARKTAGRSPVAGVRDAVHAVHRDSPGAGLRLDDHARSGGHLDDVDVEVADLSARRGFVGDGPGSWAERVLGAENWPAPNTDGATPRP
ncbi:hypothetical protein [Halomarina litorea]|uniref:hypothetical protein n=1 Tax=Halomarina litorea TaxID=2961595 RepID=UPI0020C1F77C|nr:hypothetical protein [Halomarina sp. BCD28]